MMVAEAVWIIVLNTLITVILVSILNYRIDDTNRRFENRIEMLERKLEDLRQEMRELKEEIRELRGLKGDKSFDWDDFDWNKLT